MNTLPPFGQAHARGELALHERLGEALPDAHHLARRLHLGTEDGVDAGELDEREDRLLHREVRRHHLPGDALRGERCARPCSARRSWPAAGRSPSTRRARCARRAGSPRARRHPSRPGSRTARSSARPRRAPSPWRPSGGAARPAAPRDRRERRQRAGRVAGVHAGLLDVLHDAADRARRSPSQTASTSTSIASLRKRSSSTGRVVRDLHRLVHVALEVALLRARSPSPGRPARSDGRTTTRVADRLRRLRAPPRRCAPCGSAAGAGPASLQQLLEALAVLGAVDRVGRRADDRHAGRLEVARELERRLPAELHDHAHGLLALRRSRARPRASAARSRAGRTCRSRSRRSPGCS